MLKNRGKDSLLPPLQERIILHLALSEPQNITQIDIGTHSKTKKNSLSTYKATSIALRKLVKNGLVSKTAVKSYRNKKYNLYWLSERGAYLAPVEGANSQDLLERTARTYPDNKTLQLFLEMLPLTGIELYKTAISAILTKGKLEPSDAFMIMLAAMQRSLSKEQYDQFLVVLRKHPDEYRKATDRIRQLADLLEKKGEID